MLTESYLQSPSQANKSHFGSIPNPMLRVTLKPVPQVVHFASFEPFCSSKPVHACTQQVDSVSPSLGCEVEISREHPFKKRVVSQRETVGCDRPQLMASGRRHLSLGCLCGEFWLSAVSESPVSPV